MRKLKVERSFVNPDSWQLLFALYISASVLYHMEKTPPGSIYEPSVFDPENKPLTVSFK